MTDTVWCMDHLSVGDLASVAAAIVAALIGVAGLAIVLGVERHDRYRARLDEALAAVILGLATRARERDDWTGDVPPGARNALAIVTAKARDSVGPLDVDLPAAVEVARLAGRRRSDRSCLRALGDAVVWLGLASNAWQISHSADLAAMIREWRAGEIGRREFRLKVADFGGKSARALGKSIG